jgi:hypothetical protein
MNKNKNIYRRLRLRRDNDSEGKHIIGIKLQKYLKILIKIGPPL